MALGLEDAVLLNRAGLTHRAVDRTGNLPHATDNGTRIRLQGTREEPIEGWIRGERTLGRFTHVDAEVAHEQAQQRRQQRSQAQAGQSAHDAGQQMVRQWILQQGKQTFIHH